jgi:mono/diheme cytochrome c family protein
MEVLQCGDCHTAGFERGKSRAAGAFAGGFELLDPRGATLQSANITPDPETGIGRWTTRDFVRAMRDGVRPDGSVVRAPMPRVRALDEQDLAAVHAYLGTVAPVRKAIARPAAAEGGEGGPALFERHGCAACHGEGAPFRDRLRAAAARSMEDVAAHILEPERFAPETQMPSYAGSLDAATVRALAVHARRIGAALPPPEGER